MIYRIFKEQFEKLDPQQQGKLDACAKVKGDGWMEIDEECRQAIFEPEYERQQAERIAAAVERQRSLPRPPAPPAQPVSPQPPKANAFVRKPCGSCRRSRPKGS